MSFWIYFLFILLILLTIYFKKSPVLIGAFGVLTVGIIDSKNFFAGIQVAFRALLQTATDFLPIILLIGLVVGMTRMLKETKADTIIIKPFLRLKKPFYIYWSVGLLLWVLTLFLWPTPAVSLIGAVILPIIHNTKLSPVGLALGLCIFGEGFGLSGDFIIQGAPGLLSKAAGIEVGSVVRTSLPIVIGSGLTAGVIGYFKLLSLTKKEKLIKAKVTDINHKKTKLITKYQQEKLEELSEPSKLLNTRIRFLSWLVIILYLLVIIYLLKAGIRGDSAAAATGGATILIIILGTLIINYKNSLTSFVSYIQDGLRFSMGVFAPIVVIASFFLLGTETGSEKILFRAGPGFLEQFALGISEVISLNIFTSILIVMAAAILGAMSGSGFSALPLVGGIAAALGEAGGVPVIPLAVLGQITAIWTDATMIPWGFPAVVGAVTDTEPLEIVRHNILSWLGALLFSAVWIYFMLR